MSAGGGEPDADGQAPASSPRPAAVVRPLGDRALIVDLESLAEVEALRVALERTRLDGVDDIVPAACTLAVLWDPRSAHADAVRTWVQRRLPARREPFHTLGERAGSPREADVVVDVVYDGDDLAEAAQLVGWSVDELVRRHQDAAWRVAFAGFAPGFGYLVTDDDWPEMPRRSSPRTRVPAGSVALAGAFAGVYPRESPGGWQLIGRTDAPLWAPRAARPALLSPGTHVRFHAVRALASARPVSDGPAQSSIRVGSGPSPPVHCADSQGKPVSTRAAASVARTLTVLDPGPLLLIEDLGRAGSASLGAARSGALDRGALRLANRLVGNDEGAPGLEAIVSAELRFDAPAWFAVTGARGPMRLGRREAGHPIEPDTAVHAEPGDVLTLGAAEHGLRYYVGVRGGLDAPRELASAAADLGSRLGPAPLDAGDTVALGDAVAGPIPGVDAFTVAAPPDGTLEVRVVPGPREEWFAPASVAAFYDTIWRVAPQSNRVGVRLSTSGVALARSIDQTLPAELPSEPMVPGCIQVPPSGEPTVLLADGPVTGGYPVIAVVADVDLDPFAQLRPGQTVLFRHARPGR